MKVFLIGFGRTGTKSVSHALRDAGLSVLDLRAERLNRTKLVRFWAHRDYDALRALADKYDVVEDHPWPMLYRELDEWFPDARFIFMHRDADLWLNSILKHTERRGPSENKLHVFGLDTPVGHEAHYQSIFAAHRRAVRTYFDGHPRFLEVDLSEETAQARIAAFLDLPEFDLPHRNKSA
ncbi:MAG: sulfotransferase [Pseudomonadota bacterium]